MLSLQYIYYNKGNCIDPSGKPVIGSYKQDVLELKILSVKVADSLLTLEQESVYLGVMHAICSFL